MRTLIAAVLILTCLATAGAAPIAEDAVPAKAKLATRAYNQAIDKAKATYDADVAKARRAYVQQLDRAKTQYMQDRDLDGATAVQALIDEVGTGAVEIAEKNAAHAPPSPGTKWLRYTNDGHAGWFTFGEEGSVRAEGSSYRTWSMTRDNQIRIDNRINYDPVVIHGYRIRENQQVLIFVPTPQ